MADSSDKTKIVTLKAFIFTLVLVGGGIAALFFSAACEEWHWPIRASMARELGAFALVTFTLGLWWEVLGKRSFNDELLSKIGMSRSLELAGVTLVTMDFRDTRIDWQAMLSSSSRMDVWIAYGSTWRNSHRHEIENFLQQDGNLLRILLPDFNDGDVIDSLSKRFGETDHNVLKSKISETATDFQALATGRPGKLEIAFLAKVPLFTFYRFNNSAVLAFYNHRSGRKPVPTLVCSREGTLYQYITEEFTSMWGEAVGTN